MKGVEALVEYEEAPNKALEPTPTASARASLWLLARLTAGVRGCARGSTPASLCGGGGAGTPRAAPAEGGRRHVARGDMPWPAVWVLVGTTRMGHHVALRPAVCQDSRRVPCPQPPCLPCRVVARLRRVRVVCGTRQRQSAPGWRCERPAPRRVGSGPLAARGGAPATVWWCLVTTRGVRRTPPGTYPCCAALLAARRARSARCPTRSAGCASQEGGHRPCWSRRSRGAVRATAWPHGVRPLRPCAGASLGRRAGEGPSRGQYAVPMRPLTTHWSRRQQPPLVPRSGCWRGSPRALGPSSTRVERRYAPAEATVVIGKIAFAFPIRQKILT